MLFKEIKELDAKNYMTVFNRQNLCFTHGKGSKLYDYNGKEYIDMSSGLGASCLGHDDPELTEAICRQAHRLIHVSNLYYDVVQAKLCEQILDGTIFERIFLCNSAVEANSTAVKLIRRHYLNKGEQRTKIIAAYDPVHGKTQSSFTVERETPLRSTQNFVRVPFNDLKALKSAIDDDTAAVTMEIIGEDGVMIAENDYIVNAYALCKSRGIIFAVDEAFTGMGRTGKTFAFEHYGIQPDAVTLSNALGGGVPIGAVLARGELSGAFAPGDHGSTFGGNPLSCAAASVVVSRLKGGLLEETTKKGEYLIDKLSKLKKFNFVKDVRGLGLMIGIELTEKISNVEVVGKMANAGVIIIASGRNTLLFTPAYTISYEEMDEAVSRLMDLFARTNV